MLEVVTRMKLALPMTHSDEGIKRMSIKNAVRWAGQILEMRDVKKS